MTRVRAIRRRTRSHALDTNRLPASSIFALEAATARVRYRGYLLVLTRYECLLLKLLLEHPERIFFREQLLERVWSEPGAVFGRNCAQWGIPGDISEGGE